jgi:uncharacterized protein YkwD
MRELGLGISNQDLADFGDTAPARLSGKILLKVEDVGQAYYVNPVDLKMNYLGRPADAFDLMRELGLGIKNDKLKEIITLSPYFDLQQIEKEIHRLVNEERLEDGSRSLVWNDEVATVAREHSLNIANKNQAFTGLGASCDFPLIHHVGLDFGSLNSERLNNRGVYYFSKTGENIALVSSVGIMVRFARDDLLKQETEECVQIRETWDQEFSEAQSEAISQQVKINLVRAEIDRRTAAFDLGHQLEIAETDWYNEDRVASSAVTGWIESREHQENMLLPAYDEAGVGTAYVNGYVIATQVYITRASCGYQGGACCEKEGYFPYCFVPLECDQEICQE